ncbi:transporter substrate-binding domain-containing protein [Pseudodesulfovibrio sp. zrk46]|uniref:substrate-binding periplasmic protein n=1 Tax=Pseudodesulfovibrio sp. zrk46 TaxID=2725288 RepID=UPI001FFD0180|nr:transporter substrate-binding domain-containing protein [Pseudodesulfovibrio sp. zrk46]
MVIIFCFLLSLIAARPACAGESLVLSTVEWSPLATEHLESKRLVVEIVQEAYRRAGIETNVVFVPFKRALQMAETGEVDGLVVSSLTPERAEYMFFSKWKFENEISFWALERPKTTYEDIQELCPGKVGVLRGSHVARKISSLECLEPVLINSKKFIAQLLQEGRIDYAIEGRRELRYWVNKDWGGD